MNCTGQEYTHKYAEFLLSALRLQFVHKQLVSRCFIKYFVGT